MSNSDLLELQELFEISGSSVISEPVSESADVSSLLSSAGSDLPGNIIG